MRNKGQGAAGLAISLALLFLPFSALAESEVPVEAESVAAKKSSELESLLLRLQRLREEKIKKASSLASFSSTSSPSEDPSTKSGSKQKKS